MSMLSRYFSSFTMPSSRNNNFIGKPVKEFKKKYRVMDGKLGEGSFSVVYKAVDKKNKEYAVKKINKSLVGDVETLHREVKILRKLDHPNVIKCYDVYEDNDFIWVVTIFASGGELFDRIVQKKEYDEEDAKNVVKRVAFALRFCNQKGIIHRDLKPDNILLLDKKDDTDIIIADFGFAASVDPLEAHGNTLHTQLGTPNYLAPEIIEGKTYNFKCDIWALGIITYVLLSGHLPFASVSRKGLFRVITAGKYMLHPPEIWDNVSDAAKDFISRLICVDPEKRYNYDQIVEHEWLASENENHKALTATLEAIERFNLKKRELHGLLKAYEAALIMLDLMGDDEEENQANRERLYQELQEKSAKVGFNNVEM